MYKQMTTNFEELKRCEEEWAKIPPQRLLRLIVP